jgi:hypothetical protein
MDNKKHTVSSVKEHLFKRKEHFEKLFESGDPYDKNTAKLKLSQIDRALSEIDQKQQMQNGQFQGGSSEDQPSQEITNEQLMMKGGGNLPKYQEGNYVYNRDYFDNNSREPYYMNLNKDEFGIEDYLGVDRNHPLYTEKLKQRGNPESYKMEKRDFNYNLPTSQVSDPTFKGPEVQESQMKFYPGQKEKKDNYNFSPGSDFYTAKFQHNNQVVDEGSGETKDYSQYANLAASLAPVAYNVLSNKPESVPEQRIPYENQMIDTAKKSRDEAMRDKYMDVRDRMQEMARLRKAGNENIRNISGGSAATARAMQGSNTAQYNRAANQVMGDKARFEARDPFQRAQAIASLNNTYMPLSQMKYQEGLRAKQEDLGARTKATDVNRQAVRDVYEAYITNQKDINVDKLNATEMEILKETYPGLYSKLVKEGKIKV